MKILFLDDDELRHEYAQQELIGHEVEHVRTVPEALTALALRYFDLAMLDHDLGGGEHCAPSNEVSGYEVARRISEGDVLQPRFVLVHSYNAPGAQRMIAALKAAPLRCAWIPFGPSAFLAVKGAE